MDETDTLHDVVSILALGNVGMHVLRFPLPPPGRVVEFGDGVEGGVAPASLPLVENLGHHAHPWGGVQSKDGSHQKGGSLHEFPDLKAVRMGVLFFQFMKGEGKEQAVHLRTVGQKDASQK